MDAGMLAGFIVGAVGAVLLVLAFILYRRKIINLEACLSASATVVGMTQSNVAVFTSGSTDEQLIFREEENIFKGETYAPVIEFSDTSGRKITIKGVASSPPKYSIGQQVTVWYPQSAPEKAVIDSFLEKWFVTSLVAAFGLVIFLCGLLVLLLA